MRFSSRTWLTTGCLFFSRGSLLPSLMTAELKNTQPYRQNKKLKQIKICFSLLGLWDFVSALTIFMALLAQGICRLAAPAQIEKVVFFPETHQPGHVPKGTLLLSVCPFTTVTPR